MATCTRIYPQIWHSKVVPKLGLASEYVQTWENLKNTLNLESHTQWLSFNNLVKGLKNYFLKALKVIRMQLDQCWFQERQCGTIHLLAMCQNKYDRNSLDMYNIVVNALFFLKKWNFCTLVSKIETFSMQSLWMLLIYKPIT